MSASMTDSPAPARHAVRPFYWSVRREIWENRGVYLAPLAVAGLVMLGFLFALRHLPQQIRGIAALAAQLGAPQATPTAARALQKVALGKAIAGVAFPYGAAASGLMLTAMVFAVFYSLASLHAERRDRSVLFWKSLPVSDLTTVLSKVTIPLVVLPIATAVVALVTIGLMLGLAAMTVSGAGLDPSRLLAQLDLPTLVISFPYGLFALALWHAPVIGWLMLVSAWAKRMTVLSALAPPAAICLFERLALGTTYAWDFLRHRLVSGFAVGFSPLPPGVRSTFGGEGPDPMHFLSNPGLWGGLVFTAACLAACVWLRRTRDPI
jgi:ABC-2 type transport system permease protein